MYTLHQIIHKNAGMGDCDDKYETRVNLIKTEKQEKTKKKEYLIKIKSLTRPSFFM